MRRVRLDHTALHYHRHGQSLSRRIAYYNARYCPPLKRNHALGGKELGEKKKEEKR